MRYMHGDLIELAKAGEFDLIVHGCNCFGNMGAGIAKTIKQEFPEAYAADIATTAGDRSKLGSYSQAQLQTSRGSLIVVNAYTQFDWRGKGIKADYPAIQRVFEQIAAQFNDKRIGYPLIGAGLAGGSWPVIADMIERALAGLDHCLVLLPGVPIPQE